MDMLTRTKSTQEFKLSYEREREISVVLVKNLILLLVGSHSLPRMKSSVVSEVMSMCIA